MKSTGHAQGKMGPVHHAVGYGELISGALQCGIYQWG